MSEQRSPSPSSPTSTSRPTRVLACVVCRQRKLKCSRQFPCANCIASRTQCIPAMPVKRRPRRTIPRVALMERIHEYEGLLRRHRIDFEPFDTDAALKIKSKDHIKMNVLEKKQSGDLPLQPATPSESEWSSRAQSARTLFRAMRQSVRDPQEESESSGDEDSASTIPHPWDGSNIHNGSILLGSHKSSVSISTLHPEPAHIFRLWQIYLDNINPILKITHTPSLQARLVEFIGNLSNISTDLEALVFGIYCVSIQSLSIEDCQSVFGSPKEHLLAVYQFGCEQALFNCGFLQTNSRECLSAFLLYVTSLGSKTDPRAISTLTAAAVRIAERIGIQSESLNARCGALEAELRRRLWWSLALFDARITGISNPRRLYLAPTWDCGLPLNTGDADLQAEAKIAPKSQHTATDAMFMVVRSEMGMFAGCSSKDPEYPGPASILTAVNSRQSEIPPEYRNLDAFEEMMNSRYLQFCDPGVPLHSVTLWTVRSFIAKCRLTGCYGESPQPRAQATEAFSEAIKMLEYDTTIMSSPSYAGFSWYFKFYFPLPAYIQIAMNLRKDSPDDVADHAWKVLWENYKARSLNSLKDSDPIRQLCNKVISQAWRTRYAASAAIGYFLPAPEIVKHINRQMDDTLLGPLGSSAWQPTPQPNLDSCVPDPRWCGPPDSDPNAIWEPIAFDRTPFEFGIGYTI